MSYSIVKDYKSGYTLEMLEDKYNYSKHYILKVLHYYMVTRNEAIKKVKEMEA